MSTFDTTIKPISRVVNHPDADTLDVAQVLGYTTIVGRDSFKDGDLVMYMPEATVVPEYLLERIGLVGKLAGKAHNRIKAARLRGVLSQGICVKPSAVDTVNNKVAYENVNGVTQWFAEGDDFAEHMGLTKYQPEVPASMAGEVFAIGLDYTLHYDIENIKNFPNVLAEGTPVVMTEKVHGTFGGIVLLPEKEAINGERVFMFSKGIGEQGLAFKNNEKNAVSNVYLRVVKALKLDEALVQHYGETTFPMFFMGEVFGSTIQDLGYNSKGLSFRLFDCASGVRGQLTFKSWTELEEVAAKIGVDMVPLLYKGPFTQKALDMATNGTETVSGNAVHMREGTVIKTQEEVATPGLPNERLVLKSISAAYLLRKGNATEFQ